MKVSLVLLTYNEIAGLRTLFDHIPFESLDEVFAVDGGSTDGSVEFLMEKKIKVYSQKKKGRGEAFREAFRQSTSDAIIFFGPDGNEDPKDIIKFKPLLEIGNDIVIASRMTSGAHNEEDEQLLRWRKWANNFFNYFANITWNKSVFITDTINGFRAIQKSAWAKLKLDGEGYTIEYQGSIRGFKLGLKMTEFPTYEAGRVEERVGSPSIRTGLAFIKTYVRELFVGRNF